MRSKKLLKEEKELSLEVLESGLHTFKKLEFLETLKLVKKFKLHKKKTIHFKMAKELFNKLNNNE